MLNSIPWRLGRDVGASVVEPCAQLVENGPCVLVSSCAPLLGGVAGESGRALDREDARDKAKSVERESIARARGFDEAFPSVAPAARPLAARALEERRDAGAVALHGAREVVTEESFYTLRVAARRIKERDPSRVGPTPHRRRTNALGRRRIQDGDRRGVGAEQAGGPRLLLDHPSDGREEIDGSGDAATERLRRNVDACASEARALSLDRHVLDVFVGEGFDEQRVTELSSLDDLRGATRKQSCRHWGMRPSRLFAARR
ncbi:hypothetical protein LZC94_21110 [Pendulispora albinea]|uniref:Uncharacterized protein n=1 Tax=Pendulispora albinea TaxID=2741071 RepID=A0ABZ2MB20_9BACT